MLAGVGGLVAAMVVAVSAVTFVWPSTQSPGRADAIVVLNGGGPRLETGLELASAGVAPVLVVSKAPGPLGCPQPVRHVRVLCFSPHPATTEGEARYVGALARARRWHRIVVVVTTPQVSRARLRVERCYPGTVAMVGVSPGGLGAWLYDVAYEWGAMFKALVLQRGC